ncbi:MAG: hypothetical protein UX12_C0029G0001 [Candidatus Collierbacteria bacterium GW2011_GWC1_45_47]|uniref:Uncharacterized protein n=3 Tax=Candidatus Collieribacteriota TaxID=1752725 RepID=A0A0G1KDH2_9BACT|nr:MAG: hypothetical protein UW23_C0016G0016 [Candidatus Collierbacteria bacterium GW2011_GWA1_44_12]KKT38696.1 MAG: hypothetical protein UW26_C0014G0016 [Candidatus Collierbacteria bacterium GW2011_GWF1_44_12]KKT45889.1 MAG: hypothetical protein UW35_C0028G0018 [Candidatus Collierbacteria bacterium GW2011_GWF2_44_15]KKU08861.1 MAG: hypothetical protein UX12_C0029G0001 [Candidatus Collierbacteria bacterium GW2011_GWC1_45_47]
MTENLLVKPRITVGEVVGWAERAIGFINDQELAELFDLQLSQAQETMALWSAFDLLNRVDVAYLRQLAVELAEKAEACQATWPTMRYQQTFIDPKPGHEKGWLTYISEQVAVQVAEYEKEQIEVGADSRENAVSLNSFERQALARAIENAEKVLSALDPEMGPVYAQLDKLAELNAMVTAKAEACKQVWPTKRYQQTFIDPSPGHNLGRLDYVTSLMGRLLCMRSPEASRVEAAIGNAVRLLEILRPDAPYWCRNCRAPLANSEFAYCEVCYKAYLASQESASVEKEVEVPEGLHRRIVKKPGSAKRRHSQSNGFELKGKGKQRREDEAGFEAETHKGKGDGAKKRMKRQQHENRRGEGN